MFKLIRRVVAVLFFIVLIVSAFVKLMESASSVSCSGEAELKLVKKILQEKVFGSPFIILMHGQVRDFELNAIRTVGDLSRGHRCQAVISFVSGTYQSKTEVPVNYTVELTDKGDQIYVTVD